MEDKCDCIIIGGGIAGSAAALRAAQNGMKAVWILGGRLEHKSSRSQWVMNLDNIVGFHEDIIKKQVIRTLKKGKHLAAANLITDSHYHINNRDIIKNTIERIETDYPDISIVREKASRIEKTADGFNVKSQEGLFAAPAVVLATGIMDEQPIIRHQGKKGESETSPRWIYPFANREQVLYCIRCEGHLTRKDAVAVIGYTNGAAETALMVHERFGVTVSLLTNGSIPDITPDRQTLLGHYAVEIITEPIVNVISGPGIQMQGFEFEDHKPLNVKYAFVSLGIHRVYNDLARQVGARLMDKDQPVEKRSIWINSKGETSIRNLFVAGDAAKREDEPVMHQVYTAQEYAVRCIDTIDSRKRRKIRNVLLRS